MMTTVKEIMKKYSFLNEEEAEAVLKNYKKFLKQSENADLEDMEFTIDEICDVIEYAELYDYAASKYADDTVWMGTREWMQELFPEKYAYFDDDDNEGWADDVYDFATEHNLKYDIHGGLILPDDE